MKLYSIPYGETEDRHSKASFIAETFLEEKMLSLLFDVIHEGGTITLHVEGSDTDEEFSVEGKLELPEIPKGES